MRWIDERELSRKRKIRGENMPKFSEEELGVGGLPPFLNAKHIKSQTGKLKILTPHRQGPNTPVINVEYRGNEYTFGLNKTNLKRLVAKYGDNSDDWVGKTFTVFKVMVTNPKTGEEVESLRVKE